MSVTSRAAAAVARAPRARRARGVDDARAVLLGAERHREVARQLGVVERVVRVHEHVVPARSWGGREGGEGAQLHPRRPRDSERASHRSPECMRSLSTTTGRTYEPLHRDDRHVVALDLERELEVPRGAHDAQPRDVPALDRRHVRALALPRPRHTLARPLTSAA